MIAKGIRTSRRFYAKPGMTGYTLHGVYGSGTHTKHLTIGTACGGGDSVDVFEYGGMVVVMSTNDSLRYAGIELFGVQWRSTEGYSLYKIGDLFLQTDIDIEQLTRKVDFFDLTPIHQAKRLLELVD